MEGPRCEKGVDYLTSRFSQWSQHLLNLETNCTRLYQFLCIIEIPTMEQASGLFRLVLDFLSHEEADNLFKRLPRSSLCLQTFSHIHKSSPSPYILPHVQVSVHFSVPQGYRMT